jgi:hypothetical protein
VPTNDWDNEGSALENGDFVESPPPKSILPIPSPFALREEFERAIVKDLLGPAGRSQKELLESVQSRYLVGMLAPKQSAIGREEMDEHEVVGVESGEEGSTDSGVSLRESLRPSSLGMSFCVAADAGSIVISARWGQYVRVHSQTAKNQETGSPLMVWKRIPVEETSPPVRLKEGLLKPWIVTPKRPEVSVQGAVRKHDDF